MTPISKSHCAHFYIYQKLRNCENFYISIQKSKTLCKKQDNLRSIFIHKKPLTLLYEILNKQFEIGIYIYKKHYTLLYVTFLYINNPTLRKKEDNFHYVFLIKNLTLWVTRFFMEFLKFFSARHNLRTKLCCVLFKYENERKIG